MATYASDDDLVLVRSDILSLGVASWDEQHALAGAEIERHVETNWYRGIADDYGYDWRESTYVFDATKLTKSQFKQAAIYLALSLAYEFLTRNTKDDGFAHQRDYWRKRYDREMDAVLLLGVDYDWPGDDDDQEVAVKRHPRTLLRG